MPLGPFTGTFAQQDPGGGPGKRSGHVGRYSTASDALPDIALWEGEFADWQGACEGVAVASGCHAGQIAQHAADVGADDPFQANAFIPPPVPDATAAMRARPVIVCFTDEIASPDDCALISAHIRSAPTRLFREAVA